MESASTGKKSLERTRKKRGLLDGKAAVGFLIKDKQGKSR